MEDTQEPAPMPEQDTPAFVAPWQHRIQQRLSGLEQQILHLRDRLKSLEALQPEDDADSATIP
jgi:hypothetical protein